MGMTPLTLALWLGGILVANLVLGILLVAGVYKLMEKQVAAGAFGGVGIGAIAIYAEATLGEIYLDPTVSEMKLLVIAAALGAVLGVVGMVFVFEPEV